MGAGGELDAVVQNPLPGPLAAFPWPAWGGQSSTLNLQCRNEHPGNSYDINKRSFEQYLQGSVSWTNASQCPFRHEKSCCAKIPRREPSGDPLRPGKFICNHQEEKHAVAQAWQGAVLSKLPITGKKRARLSLRNGPRNR